MIASANTLRSVHSIAAERQSIVDRMDKLSCEHGDLSYRLDEIDAAKARYIPTYEALQRLDCERLYKQYRAVAGEPAALGLLALHGKAETLEATQARYIPDVIWALIHCIVAEGKVPNV